jgi:hypothetical protein
MENWRDRYTQRGKDESKMSYDEYVFKHSNEVDKEVKDSEQIINTIKSKQYESSLSDQEKVLSDSDKGDLYYYREMAKSNPNEYNVKKETVIKYLGANAIIMSLLILIPQLMGTSKEAYRMGYEGTTGWFNAANETGAIFSFLLVIIIWLANKNKNNWLYLISIPLVVFSSYLIGTKVALGATLALLLMSILYLAFRERKKSFKIIAVLAISFVMLVVSLNSAPAVVNLERVDEGIKIRQNNYEEKEKLFTKEQIVQLDELERLKEKSVPIITKVLSSRDIYVLQNFEYFQDASLIRKIVGMGFAAEYGEKPKVTEMDFFDFFFAYGILGSGIVLILFIKKIRDWLRIEKEQISEDKNIFIILIGVLMLLAIAFVAGHVFFAPSVSFYLAIGIVLLIKKKEVVEIKS